jgi:predicted CopG family antitoxin
VDREIRIPIDEVTCRRTYEWHDDDDPRWGIAGTAAEGGDGECLVCLVRKPYPVCNTALISLREVAMSVRLNITMDDDVYARLKKEVPSKKLSAFITGAVRAKLYLDAKALDVAYQAASKEQWRKSLDENWKHIDAEGCPK